MINSIYEHCKILGNVFGYGALEGFIIYSGVIVWGVLVGINSSCKKVKKWLAKYY